MKANKRNPPECEGLLHKGRGPGRVAHAEGADGARDFGDFLNVRDLEAAFE